MIAVTLLTGDRLSSTEAVVDSGADMSLFEEGIAHDLGLDIQMLPAISLSGVGGLVRQARVAEVTLRLLGYSDLEVTMEVAFAPDVELGHGNLIGLDVLEHFDFGLSHRRRLGYLGRALT